ncbi:MAG: hypothetical protein WKF75_00750 [Singulisphaera sp.]
MLPASATADLPADHVERLATVVADAMLRDRGVLGAKDEYVLSVAKGYSPTTSARRCPPRRSRRSRRRG